MAYQGPNQYGHSQSYQNQQQSPRPSYTDDHGDNRRAGYGIPQNQWSNGLTHGQPPPASYAPISSPRSANYDHVPGYGDQIQSQQDLRSPTSYNPRQYPAQTSQYNPQAYSAVNASYQATPQGYNPATYADPYTQAQSGSQYQHHQPTYSPSQYQPAVYQTTHATTYAQASPSYAHTSPSLSYNSPPLGYAQHQSGYNQDYNSPRFPSQEYRTSSVAAHPQTYSTYSQPAPQMASYAPSSPDPPRYAYDYSHSHDYMNIPDHPNPSISPALPGLTSDEMLQDPSVLPPSSSLSTPGEDRSRVSPLYTPDNESPAYGAPPPAPPHRSGTIGRHPHSRPLPGPPEPDEGPIHTRTISSDNLDDFDDERRAQDELFDQVESAVLNAGGATSSGSRPHSSGDTGVMLSGESPRPLFGFQSRHNRSNSQVNGHTSPGASNVSGDEDDDSDLEAAAGLEAMRIAEEEDRQDVRRRSSGGSAVLFQRNREQRLSQQGHLRQESAQRSITEEDEDSGNDFPGVDMSLYNGGYSAPDMPYGGDPSILAIGRDASNSVGSSHPSSGVGSLRRPAHERETSYDHVVDTIAPPPQYGSDVRVERVGTGGLADPSLNRRQSYDEGDEFTFNEDELFFHPGLSSRPLPPPPPSTSDSSTQGIDTPPSSVGAQLPGLFDGHAYNLSAASLNQQVPRSASLIQPRSAPHVEQPARSKTDAEERLRRQGYRTSLVSRTNSMYSQLETPAVATAPIDLPTLPSRRFTPAKLGPADFKRCERPWALSAIYFWLRQVASPDEVSELREAMIKEALAALFSYKVPTLNITDVEVITDLVVDEMYKAGVLKQTEEWVKLSPGTMSGVIMQLTMAGCYSQRLHDYPTPGRCYSYYCQRTLRKVDLNSTPSRASEDWATFYKLKKEDVESAEAKEIEVQNNIHEIVQTEDGYMEQLTVLQTVYRDALVTADPSIIPSKRLQGFVKDVFGKVDAIREANEQHLLAQLKYRQIEQGPWIKGVSDVFRQWIRKARAAYIEYAAAFPAATLLVRAELEQNLHFRAFVDKARANKLSSRLSWDTYLKAPITRLQRYSLLLFTVHRNMRQESDEQEKERLAIAIEEIKAVTLECDARLAEMQRKVELSDLANKLILRPGMEKDVELNLNHLGRELIHSGDLQRYGGSRFSWLDCHALLFDHYMILAKSVFLSPKGTTVKIEKYDVSRLPIPMDLLVLESINDDAVMKSTYMRGITSVTTVPSRPIGTPDGSRLSRMASHQGSAPSHFGRTDTASSATSIQSTASAPPAVTSLETKDSDKIIYPFRIKHLGREPYVVFAPTAASRIEWGTKIIEAKTRHAKSLHAQNAEPFKLRVIADSAFYYDYSGGTSSGSKAMVIEGTPMDRAIKEVERKFKDTGRPGPICRARVNCATSFTTPYPGKHMVAVGTDYGVYATEMENPRGWTKVINIPKVTQIAVLEEFNLFLLISSGALIAYHLDLVTNPDRIGATANESSARKAPQKLSGSKDVGFFAVGRMKDRTLLFYKKRDGLSSTFKVLEPVFQKSTEKKRGVFKRGTTEFFRSFDEFYIPSECTGINLFHSAMAVSTAKGFEVLTLDKKQSFSVPDLRAPEVANIATHLDGLSTLGMLRLSEQEFLLCYERCAVYVNRYGDVSRSVIMTFVGRARAAALYGPYLILFDNDFVEVRNAQNGRLKQIIAGRDVKCLDDGGGGTLSGGGFNSGVVNGVPALGAGSRTVKVVMQHPENERGQIIVELVLNDELKE